MPAAVSAIAINYEFGSRSVIIDMTAQNREDIALFLKKLHDDPAFTDINISAINGISPDFRFTIILVLK
jgi:cell fate regulator YaaT (PSP1 superfamily)